MYLQFNWGFSWNRERYCEDEIFEGDLGSFGNSGGFSRDLPIEF
jgi:hypothetical protein